METRLARIEEKLDKISEIQSEIRVDLQYHIRRTDLLEEATKSLADTIAPIQEHVSFIRVAGKLLTVLGTVAAGIAALLALR